MVLIIRGKTLLLTAVLVCAVILTAGFWAAGGKTASVDDQSYRVFVAGLGTVEGKWHGETGIAIIGLETRPAASAGEELKVIDLLVANGTSGPIQFDADINLVSPQGKRYGLNAKDQPVVRINPGALSQGTVIIDVPKGTPDKYWLVEIKGGNLKDGITLPLRVVKVKE